MDADLQISAQSEEDAATLAAYLALSTEEQQQLWEAYYQCLSADDVDGACTPDPHTGEHCKASVRAQTLPKQPYNDAARHIRSRAPIMLGSRDL